MTGLSPHPRGLHLLGDVVGPYLIMLRVSPGGARIDWAVTRQGDKRIIEQGSDRIDRYASPEERSLAMEGRLAILSRKYRAIGRMSA